MLALIEGSSMFIIAAAAVHVSRLRHGDGGKREVKEKRVQTFLA